MFSCLCKKSAGTFKGSAVLVLAFLLAGCASRLPLEEEKVPAAAPSQKTEKAPAPAVRVPPGNGLGAPRFRNIPPEARDYLETLAEAFRKKDREFLASQGEGQYEKELRSRLDEEIYLALLYRIGPYSEDSPWQSQSPPRLDTSTVQGIEYSDWKENGPMLEISGRLYLSGGGVLPCRIVLVWRLPEPKILGERP